MSIRTIAGFVDRVSRLAETDPSPDARAAYRVCLQLLSRVDDCRVEDLFEAVERAFQTPERPRAAIVDDNPEADLDWRDDRVEEPPAGDGYSVSCIRCGEMLDLDDRSCGCAGQREGVSA